MYRVTIRQVGRAVTDLHFEDSAFRDRLDIRFAQLYCQALNAHEEGRSG